MYLINRKINKARVEGIEPPIAVLETAVIPLNHTRFITYNHIS